MQIVRQMYESTICRLPSSEQLLLARLILEGATQHNDAVKSVRQYALDILDELPGGGIFKTSAEVDAYLREERDSWD